MNCFDPWALCFLSQTDEYTESDTHMAIVNECRGKWSAQLNDKDSGQHNVKHHFATKDDAKQWCMSEAAAVRSNGGTK